MKRVTKKIRTSLLQSGGGPQAYMTCKKKKSISYSVRRKYKRKLGKEGDESFQEIEDFERIPT